MPDHRSLLSALLGARTPNDVRDILHSIGDYADAGLDEEFGDSYVWRAFGDKQSNISTIGLGSKTGRSLTERITNMEDALLEDRSMPGVSLPKSPRDAAQQWFGRPVSGPDDGLYKWDFSGLHIDRRMAVVMLDSGQPEAPTVDVVDEGIGIRSDAFPDTILSLQQGNKINKRYLVGAFGQGGAATLAFCKYALIVSRHRDNPGEVGFTVVRVLNLNESFKEDCYGYLCIKELGKKAMVPSCSVDLGGLNLYEKTEAVKRPPILTKGTLVRHYAYELSGLDKALAPSPGNLYTFLHCSMFDPLFPFRIIDLRDSERSKDELVTGSRNRLLRLVLDTAAATKAGKTAASVGGTEIRHYRPMEYVVPHGSDDACIGIEYWVAFNHRKAKKGQEYVLRSSTNELFVQAGYPIVGTLNGQNQGELPAQLIRELGLGMVSRHMIVHIDASNASSRVRRELFSTSREGFKDGVVLTELTRVLKKMLEEDENLFAIERELTEKLARRDLQQTSEEVKRHVSKLLQEAGLEVREEGPAVTAGDGEPRPHGRPKKKRGQYKNADPLPTLPFPQATKLRIVWPTPKLDIHQYDVEVILVETDADSEFDKRGLVAIRSEPPLLQLAGKAPLRGGRIRWRLRPTSKAEAGAKGKVVVTLTKPDGIQLTDSVDYEVLAAIEEKTQQTKGYVPPFEIVPINPDDNPTEWGMAWPLLAEEEDPQALSTVAYRAVRAGGKIWVYYSTIFGPFAEVMSKLKTETSVFAEFFRNSYEVWIGYHAILQETNTKTSKHGFEEDQLDEVMEEERCRVARVQVKQGLQMARLQHDAVKQQHAGKGGGD